MKEIISKATIGPVLFHSELAKEAATIFASKISIFTKACVSKIAIFQISLEAAQIYRN